MSDIDIVVNHVFATTGTQSRAERVMTHELGHALMLGHARCKGNSCTEPLMHPQALNDIQMVDADGGREVFAKSAEIINSNFDCYYKAQLIEPVPIGTGGCGSYTSTNQLGELNIRVFPNPTTGKIQIEHDHENLLYRVLHSSGEIVDTGILLASEQSLDLSHLPDAIYFCQFQTEKGISVIKIIKL